MCRLGKEVLGVGVRVLRNSLYIFFFQAEDGIRDLVRSRGLGDVYKRQLMDRWEYFNPNPVRGKRTGDCVVRAICKATGFDLSLIHI